MNIKRSILITFIMSAMFVTTSLADTSEQKKLKQQKKLQQKKRSQQKKQQRLRKAKAASRQEAGEITNREKSKFLKFNEKVGKGLAVKEGGKVDRFLRGGKFIKKLTINEQGKLGKLFQAKAITRKLTSGKKRYGQLNNREKLAFRNRLTSDERNFIDQLISDRTITSIDELFVKNSRVGKFFRAESLYHSDSLIYELNSAESFLLAEEYLNQHPQIKRK